MSQEGSDQVASARLHKTVKHKRRFCRVDGCQRIVKSQGLCQRHGAKPKKCQIPGCSKQAQGNFNGMCKSHFREYQKVEAVPSAKDSGEDAMDSDSREGGFQEPTNSVYTELIPSSISWTPKAGVLMPLLAYLKEGYESSRQPAWHRTRERQIRGLGPTNSPSGSLEDWEVDLVFAEALVLSGSSQISFKYLAYAWGKETGFHVNLTRALCRKKASLQTAAAALGQDDNPSRLFFEVNQGHYRSHSIDHRAKPVASTVSLGDSTRATTKPRSSRYVRNRLEVPLSSSTSSLSSSFEPRRHCHGQSSSLTLDCEEWNAGTMVRYHEVDFSQQNGQTLPRCDSPLKLDQKLLDDLYESEPL